MAFKVFDKMLKSKFFFLYLLFVFDGLNLIEFGTEFQALSGLDSAISKSRQVARLNGNVSLDATLNAQLNYF